MNFRLTLWIVTATLPLIAADTAISQTRTQCDKIATAMPNMITAISGASKQMSNLDWAAVSRASSGQFKNAIDAAGLAQDNLQLALKRYLAAIQDVTYQAQVCAR